MISAMIVVLSLAAVIGALVVARRRRRAIERFAELAGVRRLHGESLDELLARAAARFRVVSSRPLSRSMPIGVAEEHLGAGDMIEIDASTGRIRRAKS